MKLKQFLSVCLVSCAAIQCNVLQTYAKDETIVKPAANAIPQGEVETNLKLSISPDQKRYWLGDPIVINITLKNAGKADVPLEDTGVLLDYQIEVVLPNGTKAVITIEGKKLMENLAFYQNTVSGVIPAGKEGGNQFKYLTKLYDMKQDGVYQITLSRMVPRRIDPKMGAKSRYTYIRMTEEEWQQFSNPPTAKDEATKMKEKAIADKEKAIAAAEFDKEWVKITSNTIRIGVGEIPDGALDEKPVEKAAPAKTDEAKSSPPIEPKAK